MRKSIIAVIVVSSFASLAANASITDSEYQAAYQQFAHGVTFYNTAPLSTPANQFNDAYNEAKAGLARMGVKAGDFDSVIANSGMASNQQTLSQFVGYELGANTSKAAPTPATTMAVPVAIEPALVAQLTPVAPVQKTPVAPVVVVPPVKTPDATPVAQPQATPVAHEQKVPEYKVPVSHAQSIPVAQSATQKAPVEQKIPTIVNPQATPVEHNVAVVAPVVAQKTPVAPTQLTPSRNGEKGDKGDKGDAGESVTTVKTVNVVDTAAHKAIETNTANVAANRGEIIAQSHSIAANTAGVKRNSAAIERNSSRIAKNEQDIKDVKQSVKRLGASAAASANLHYNRAESGYAVAVGEYKGATAIAGGVQFNTSANTAATVQVSYDGEGVGASVGFHGSW